MGINQSPDIAQEIMEDLFRHMDEVDNYIDDVGCFNDSWESHLSSLDKVFKILESNNFTVNPYKCEWAVQETDWLGYWLTPTGLKPWKKKVDAILKIERPQTVKQLRSFLGAVNFYRDMYPKRSHILAPLTALTGKKGPLTWTNECQQAFDQMKALRAQEAFLQYPNHNQPFEIYADASDLQLGAAIFQNGKPVAFYSRKLNSAQKNYTVGEKELLSVVETLKEFKTMLYGAPNITVYTDHKNNTFSKFSTQRVLRWRLILEDYGVQFKYIKGSTNTLADALSRLPIAERQTPTQNLFCFTENFLTGNILPGNVLTDNTADDSLESYFSMAINDDDLLDCFIHLPASTGIPFVLGYDKISARQVGDARLVLLRN